MIWLSISTTVDDSHLLANYCFVIPETYNHFFPLNPIINYIATCDIDIEKIINLIFFFFYISNNSTSATFC